MATIIEKKIFFEEKKFPQRCQDFILGNWTVCGKSQKLFNAKTCDLEEWVWIEQVMTTPFFFGPKQGVASNYEIDFLVWHTVKSEVNSQKKVKSKSVWNELDFLGPNMLGPVFGCIRFHKCFGSKWYVIWDKPFRLQKVLPSLSEKITLNWVSSHYLSAHEVWSILSLCWAWEVTTGASECRSPCYDLVGVSIITIPIF